MMPGWSVRTDVGFGINSIMRSSRALLIPFLLGGTILLAELFAEDTLYRQPPKPGAKALNAASTPAISVSPQRDYAIFLQPVRYPPIADVAQPMLRLAGIRIDSNTNGMHLAPTYTSYSIKRLANGADVKISPPRGAKLRPPVWSPDGNSPLPTRPLTASISGSLPPPGPPVFLASTPTSTRLRLAASRRRLETG